MLCAWHRYEHVECVLDRIESTKVQPLGASLCLVVGDFQTYQLMFWLKKFVRTARKYEWLLPMPCEWHFKVHALMAIHALWRYVLSLEIVNALPGAWEKTIKESWTSVEVFDHYDRFYQMLIVSLVECVARASPLASSALPAPSRAPALHHTSREAFVWPRYLVDVVPDSYLYQPVLLLAAVKPNPAAHLAVTFLFEFGLPYLHFVQATRANQHKVMDICWRLFFHWFRATNKFNYSHLAVYVTFFRHGMKQGRTQCTAHTVHLPSVHC